MELLKELYKAARSTRLTTQKIHYYLDIPDIVIRLAEQISTRSYQPGTYTCFAIADPTPREILAPSYPDRIVHRWLINKMEPYIDKRFLPCSYANRTGKGHHRAVKQLQRYLQNPANKYYLKMDIESFFNSIAHNVLLNLVKHWIMKLPYTEEEKEIILSVAATIITHNPTQNVIFTGDKEKLKYIPAGKSYFNNPPGRGLPLGNLSSQFFANIYLHELDWFVKQKLKVRYYLRYVDDIVMLAETTDMLKYWRTNVEKFLLENLQLKLHSKKIIIQPTRSGIDFLGYIVRKDYMLVRGRVVKNFKQKLHIFNQQNSFSLLERKTVQGMLSCINSYYGIFGFADTYHLRKDIYLNHLGYLQKVFSIDDGFQKMGISSL